MPKIKYIKNGQTIEIESDEVGQSLLSIAQANGVDMDTACGGNGVCTTCLVKVVDGAENLGPVTEKEEIMGMDATNPEYRLGCQCSVEGDCEVELAY
jgi:ferredoxin